MTWWQMLGFWGQIIRDTWLETDRAYCLGWEDAQKSFLIYGA